MDCNHEQILTTFKEAGEWWEGRPERTVTRYFDRHHRLRERIVEGEQLGLDDSAPDNAPIEDYRIDFSLRIQKIRDEKVLKASGLLPVQNFEILNSSGCGTEFVGLHAVSAYSFGYSSILAEEFGPLAAGAEMPALLLADRYSVAGSYEFERSLKKVGVRPLHGASIELIPEGELVLVAQSKRGWSNLCQLLSACHLQNERRFPRVNWPLIERYSHNLLCIIPGSLSYLYWLISKRDYSAASAHIQRLQSIFGANKVFVEIEISHLPHEDRIIRDLLAFCDQMSIPAMAGGPKAHARRNHFPAMDVNACIEGLCTIEDIEDRKCRFGDYAPAHRITSRRFPNAERYFRTRNETLTAYHGLKHLLDNTRCILDLCDKDILPGRAALPSVSADEPGDLTRLVQQSVTTLRKNATKAYTRRLENELQRVIALGFSGHFLIAYDICKYAQEECIGYSARGSVVDSLLAFHLEMTTINAYDHKLFFDRFLPADGSKRPDIDIDFEAARRNDIRQYLVKRFGEDHVCTVAAFGSMSTRGIVREVGKVMGLPSSMIGFLAKKVHGGIPPNKLIAALEKRPELRDSNINKERYRWIFRLAERLTDIPRNIRAHSSGVIVSAEPITTYVAKQLSGDDLTEIIQWDKRSAKFVFDKFDILCLRGQDVLGETTAKLGMTRLEESEWDNEQTYSIMASGKLIGVPQSASPAMRQAHVRLQTENLFDASLVQAGIRPGVGGAVKINELIARRRGKAYAIEHPDLEPILGLTYGIIVFQEQVDQLLQKFAKYTAGEAEDTRERIYKMRRESFAASIKQEVLDRIILNGYSNEIAQLVYEYVSGFEGYGFAQGHALAFAEISLKCTHLQNAYPATYFSALLNAQPAGYYGPVTIANEARQRGIRLLRPTIGESRYKAYAFDEGTIQLGWKDLHSVSETSKQQLAELANDGEQLSIYHAISASGIQLSEFESLIKIGAFDRIERNRRRLLWSAKEIWNLARTIGKGSLDFNDYQLRNEHSIKPFSIAEEALLDRKLLGLDVERHIVAFERKHIKEHDCLSTKDVYSLKPGEKCAVVGNPIRLRFPPTKSGKRVVFFDLEDETGLLNVTCFDATYIRDGAAIICSPYVTIRGEVQDRDGHLAFLAKRIFPYKPVMLAELPDDPKVLPVGDFLVG